MGTLKDNLAVNGIQDSFFENIDLDEIEIKNARDNRIKKILRELRKVYWTIYNLKSDEESKVKLRVEWIKLMEELNSLGINAKEEVAKIIKKIEGAK